MAKIAADKSEKPLWEKEDVQVRMDIGAWMAYTGKSLRDLAPMMGISGATMYSRYKHPGDMSLDEARKLYRVIGKVVALRTAQ